VQPKRCKLAARPHPVSKFKQAQEQHDDFTEEDDEKTSWQAGSWVP
jgi:hypothetical protein